MARLPQHFIQQVQQATDIVELVGQYVALTRKGKEFVALCPFHDDHKPSMCVVPAKQIFHCFVCGAGGSVFRWMELYEKVSFPEAVRALAERANIPLPSDYEPEPLVAGLSKGDLVGVAEWAAGFFQQQLASPGGAKTLTYARGRGLSDESIAKFSLGYAPNSWDALLLAAGRAGISQEQLVAAGLVRRREQGGCYDYFRDRLMFPIHDLGGRVVAFGGRAMASDSQAKYLNSPDTAMFDKSSLAYGLSFAREAIVRRKQAVVVEGYFDVLLPLQSGVDNVVATLGTALTERHVRLLSRYAQEVVLLFDADAAGASAAQRALQLFIAQRVHVRVATIPEGKDPCDFVLANGPEAMRELIDQAPDALQYVWQERYRALHEAGAADNPTRRNELITDFLQLIVTSETFGAIDAVQQQSLAQHIAHLLNVPAIDLQQQMRRLRRGHARPRPAQAHCTAAVQGVHGEPQREILEVLLDRPDLFDDAAERIDPEHFTDAMLQTIARWVWQLGLADKLSLDEILATEELVSLQPTLVEMSLAGQRRGNHEQTLRDAVALMLQRQAQARLRELKAESTAGDDEKLRTIQQKLIQDQNAGSWRSRRPRID
jgi:DNA primase